jgi:hypothetical protein
LKETGKLQAAAARVPCLIGARTPLAAHGEGPGVRTLAAKIEHGRIKKSGIEKPEHRH